MNAVNLSKEDSKLISWLYKATSKDKSREVLNHIHVVNGKTESCDGHRMHEANTPECLREYEGKIISLTTHTGLNEVTVIDYCNYPDTSSVKPKGEPSFTIGVNPKYLIEALSAYEAGSLVILNFYTPTKPFTVSTKDGEQDALIMPMYIG